jgi:hypothetical protein
MRRYGVHGAYEKLKEVTRGKTVSAEDLHGLIRSLDIPQAEKDRLLAMTPASYTGKAAELARRVWSWCPHAPHCVSSLPPEGAGPPRAARRRTAWPSSPPSTRRSSPWPTSTTATTPTTR